MEKKNLKLIYFGSEKSNGQQNKLPSPKRLWWLDLEESAQFVQSHPQ
jgi:hypothetical protein